MKAFLLAAGLGSRLAPLTDTVPKCLIPILGRPLLDWWVELFQQHVVTDVLLNTHHLREQVGEYISLHNASKKIPQIHEFYEETLLGSGGTVIANRDFTDDEDFLICYADILTNIDLTALHDFHKSHSEALTVALAPTSVPTQSGIAILDETGLITDFEEKPANPKGNLANAGIYIARQSIFPHFPQKEYIDFATDILQNLTGKMYGQVIKGYHIDIGTLQNYQIAQDEWGAIVKETSNIP